MLFTTTQLHGATSLLQDGLRLSAGDTLLLLHQNTLLDAAQCISQAAAALKIEVDSRTFRRQHFRNGFPEAFSGARIPEPVPRGIALLIEWSEATTKGRLMLLKHLQNTGKPWRVASMPGVDLAGLAFCASDFKDIRDKSRDTFAILARAKMCYLCTRSPGGDDDELAIPIGDFCPMISTGEIAEGSWGNFPSGETFTLPNQDQASGMVTLRGSFPTRPLENGEWVRFAVKRGRLVARSITASDEALATHFRSLFFTHPGRPKSKNANSLAELGVGTNRRIGDLTGNPIFDEKKLDTVHIAFGSNAQFNGPLVSRAHHDLTCIGASLRAGSTLIIQRGRFCLKRSTAIRSLSSFPAYPDLASQLFPGSSVVAELSGDDLAVRYTPYRGGPISFSIASGEEAHRAQSIIKYVSSNPEVRADKLLHHFCDDVTQKLLIGLIEYRIIEKRHEAGTLAA